MKVLCIGAYSNGNIGDMYQADAIAVALKGVDPTSEVASLSPSKRESGYPATAHTIISPDRLYDANLLNSFDLILVGGGGLLASPHHPLADPDWVKLLRTTVCALGVGVAAKHAAEAGPFIRACTLFSVRDEYSLAAVRPLRPDATIVMDPILLAPDAFCPAPPQTRGAGIVWVPGKLVKDTAAFYADVHLTAFDPRNDWIVSFNELTDRGSGFEDVFGERVIYLNDVEGFQRICARARFVVSERYHGCILALRQGVPCVGVALRSQIVTSKITELYRRLGLEGDIVTMNSKWTRSALRTRSEICNPDSIRGQIDQQRLRYTAFLSECMQTARAVNAVRA